MKLKSIILAVLCMGLLATTAIAFEEDVAQFKEWYGVRVGDYKKIVTFSFTDEATLYVSMDNQKNVKFEVYNRLEDDSVGIKAVEVDGEPIILYFDYRMTQEFARGGSTVIWFLNKSGEEVRQEFSLLGFTKAYRWLIK